MKPVIAEALGQIEDELFRARRVAWQEGCDDIYGKLDNALLRLQGLTMLLSLETNRNEPRAGAEA
jgi:hypothetical protein